MVREYEQTDLEFNPIIVMLVQKLVQLNFSALFFPSVMGGNSYSYFPKSSDRLSEIKRSALSLNNSIIRICTVFVF